MSKKNLFLIIVLSMIFGSMAYAFSVQAAVCGIDGEDYASADAAEAVGVDISYEFACVNPSSEIGLYEKESDAHFTGMLIEVGSTDIPTTLIIRDNAGSVDYTVEINSDTILGQRHDQATNLSDWIPGDQIRIIGKKNENTETITAAIAVNLSIKIGTNQGANGWITAINKEAKTITYQWANVEHTFAYDDNTRFVSGLKNPATVDDLNINDRLRARLLVRSGQTPLAKIIIVLRRGPDLFMKIRTFRPNVTLVRLDSAIVPTTIQVRIDRTPGLRANDVNNLIGAEGALVTVNVTENTKIVRKYFGHTTLEEFSVGDHLRIVGRVNDDGTVDAKLIKNNSIWKTSTQGHAGVVAEVNTNDSYLMVNWTPIKYPTLKVLKSKLETADNAVSAQAVNLNLLSANLKNRITKIKAVKIGKFLRNVKHKKVKIERIKHSGIELKDLIVRQPIRKVRVDITADTKIVIGTNINATISDIQTGDKVRIRGTRHANLPLVAADTIVVVNSLPEIDEPLDTVLDDINEVVSEIITDDTGEAIIDNIVTDTEEEIGGVDETSVGLEDETNNIEEESENNE